jgi:hypothetical protein
MYESTFQYVSSSTLQLLDFGKESLTSSIIYSQKYRRFWSAPMMLWLSARRLVLEKRRFLKWPWRVTYPAISKISANRQIGVKNSFLVAVRLSTSRLLRRSVTSDTTTGVIDSQISNWAFEAQ